MGFDILYNSIDLIINNSNLIFYFSIKDEIEIFDI